MPKKKVFVARNEMLDDEWVGNLLCVSASFFALQEELRRGGGLVGDCGASAPTREVL